MGRISDRPSCVTNELSFMLRTLSVVCSGRRGDSPLSDARSSMKHEKLFSPREAAQVLGVSYPTLKQWIYKKKIRTIKTAGGHHRIPEREIDKYLSRVSPSEGREPRDNFRRVSGRTQLVGR